MTWSCIVSFDMISQSLRSIDKNKAIVQPQKTKRSLFKWIPCASSLNRCSSLKWQCIDACVRRTNNETQPADVIGAQPTPATSTATTSRRVCGATCGAPSAGRRRRRRCPSPAASRRRAGRRRRRPARPVCCNSAASTATPPTQVRFSSARWR